jgi:hypothetical protein
MFRELRLNPDTGLRGHYNVGYDRAGRVVYFQKAAERPYMRICFCSCNRIECTGCYGPFTDCTGPDFWR